MTRKEELEDTRDYLMGRNALTPGEVMELKQVEEELELLDKEESNGQVNHG